MLPAYKSFLGSRLGSGKQWISWIHLADLYGIFRFLMENERLAGAFNCTSPNPVRNKEFASTLRGVLCRPTLAPPVPGFAMKLALGEMANTLLKGQRVIPRRLLDEGYRFQYPSLEGALTEILGREDRS
jgi:hypothetical protein